MRYSVDRIEKLSCSDGQQRTIHVWEPDAPRMVFLAVHGLMDHPGNFILPALYFKKHGIVTIAHAQRGHDHQGPDHPKKVIVSRFEYLLEDLGSMVQWVKEQYPDLPIFIIAHSMGALVATHFGIRNLKEASPIRGFILSAPYFVNAVKVPQIMLKLVSVLALLVPRMIVPTDDFKEVVTRDREVYNRQREDERAGVVVTSVTCGMAYELLKAQRWIPENLARWKHNALVILAGDDRVADTRAARDMLGEIEPEMITELYYEDNFHENFNEVNREEVYARILEWVEEKL